MHIIQEETQKSILNLLKHHQESLRPHLFHLEEDLSFAAYDDDTFLGGITGKIIDESLHISLLAVDPHKQRQGTGKKLLAHIEDYACAKGCKIFTLSTLDYQAKDFYLKQGYEVFAKLEGIPKENTIKYYMVKRV